MAPPNAARMMRAEFTVVAQPNEEMVDLSTYWELLKSLETARSIRWYFYGEQPSGGVDGGALGGWEQPAPVPLEGGYWQL